MGVALVTLPFQTERVSSTLVGNIFAPSSRTDCCCDEVDLEKFGGHIGSSHPMKRDYFIT